MDTWLEEQERELIFQELKNKRRVFKKSKKQELFDNLKLILMVIFLGTMFSLEAKPTKIKQNRMGCDYTIVTCKKCGYEYYAESDHCPVCGKYR